MADISLTTDRLLLRRWQSDDIQVFAAMCSDPAVMRYIGAGNTLSPEQTEQSVRGFEREWDEKGFGLFAVELLEDKSFIGFTGLSEPAFLPEIMPAVEIGWRLAQKYWGCGYASEAARATLEFGFTDRNIPSIVSIVQSGYEASRKIIKKLGMHFDRQTHDPTCDRLVEVYRIQHNSLHRD